MALSGGLRLKNRRVPSRQPCDESVFMSSSGPSFMCLLWCKIDVRRFLIDAHSAVLQFFKTEVLTMADMNTIDIEKLINEINIRPAIWDMHTTVR